MAIAINLISSKTKGKSKFHGGSEYVNSLIVRIIDSYKQEANIDNGLPNLFFIVAQDDDDVALRKITSTITKISFWTINDYIELKSFFKRNSIKRFYDPLWNGRIPFDSFEGVELYMTIHGLRSIEMPTDKYEYVLAENTKARIKAIYKRFFPKKYIQKLIDTYNNLMLVNAENLNIIVPSQHTLNSVKLNLNEKIYKINRLKVLYSPASVQFSEGDAHLSLEKFGIMENKYFLVVSGNRWIKNPIRVIEAFNLLEKKGLLNGFKLVITGVVSEKLKGFLQSSSVVLLGYLSPAELKLLYKNCYALIYPSLNEGFGYPPLECMQYGKPVLASNISSIAEVSGSAPIYFNPYDYREMANRVLSIINDQALYKLKQSESIAQFKKVSLRQEDDLNTLVELLLSKW